MVWPPLYKDSICLAYDFFSFKCIKSGPEFRLSRILPTIYLSSMLTSTMLYSVNYIMHTFAGNVGYRS
jgi:hypothetical protein